MKKLSDGILYEKLQHYCAYRERCLQEVILKLKELGAEQAVMATIIDKLVKENFINEKRFAEVFARSKFRINKWGKQKIIAELGKRKIPEKFVIIGLAEVDYDDYLITLETLIQKKAETLDRSDKSKLKLQLARYAITKGYETDLVWNLVKNME